MYMTLHVNTYFSDISQYLDLCDVQSTIKTTVIKIHSKFKLCTNSAVSQNFYHQDCTQHSCLNATLRRTFKSSSTSIWNSLITLRPNYVFKHSSNFIITKLWSGGSTYMFRQRSLRFLGLIWYRFLCWDPD